MTVQSQSIQEQSFSVHYFVCDHMFNDVVQKGYFYGWPKFWCRFWALLDEKIMSLEEALLLQMINCYTKLTI